MRGGMLDPGSSADAAGAAASLRCRMCDDAWMEALRAPAEEARLVKEEAKQQDQLNSLLEPSWPGGRQEDSVPQALDRLGGRQVSFAGAQ